MSSWFVSQTEDHKGVIQSDSKKIMEIFDKFYSNLYTSKHPKDDDIQFLTECKLPKLKETHEKLLDAEFAAKELLDIVKGLKLNKTLSPDGFIVEY